MFLVSNVKRKLLELLVKSGKPIDRTKRVPVHVSYDKTVNGKTVHVNGIVWKTPDEVAHDDKVRSNHHLLPKDHPSYRARPANNIPIPQHVTDQVNDWCKKTMGDDRQKIFDFMDQHGIAWQENEKNPSINFMHAKRALKIAIHLDGFNLSSPHEDWATPNPSGKGQTTAKQAENPAKIDAKAGGKKKTSGRKSTSPEAKAKASEYYRSTGKDHNKLVADMEKWGIDFPRDVNGATAVMRALEYLGKAIDKGFDPNNPQPLKQDDQKQLKDQARSETKDPSAVYPPLDSTERERNLAKHINNLTNPTVIEASTRLGVVPEDQITEELIVQTWQNAMVEDISKAPPEVKERMEEQWGKEVLTRLMAASKNAAESQHSNSPKEFGKLISEKLSLGGCKRNIVQEGFDTLASKFNMATLTDPRATLSTVTQNGSKGENGGTHVADLIQQLNHGFSDHTSDEHEGYNSNLGYTGFDPTVYADRFKSDQGKSDGFMKYLEKIRSENPGNNQLDAAINKYQTEYKGIMTDCHGNPNLLNAVLTAPNWSEKYDEYDDNQKPYRSSDFGNAPLQYRYQAVDAVNKVDKASDVVLGELKKRGYSDAEIITALEDTARNDDLSKFTITKGGKKEEINFREVRGENGKKLLKKDDCSWGINSLLFTRAKLQAQIEGDSNFDSPNSIPKGCENAVAYYKAAKQMATFTPDQYKKVHKAANEMFGVEYTKGGKPVDYDSLKVDELIPPWTRGVATSKIKDSYDESSDHVLSNLIMGGLHHAANTAMARTVQKSTKGVNNNNGTNYAGNYDYYSGTVMGGQSDKRYTQHGNPSGGATYTAQQLSDKIASQTASAPSYSPDYLENVKNYYKSHNKAAQADNLTKLTSSGVDSMMDSPVKDVLYKTAHAIAGHSPTMAEKKRYDRQVAKVFNYVPFNFEQATNEKQPRRQAVKENPEVPTPTEAEQEKLRDLRQGLMDNAVYSLGALSKEKSLEYMNKMATTDMDYKGGYEEATPDGNNVPKRKYTSDKNNIVSPEHSRVVIFTTPVFEVHNHPGKDDFDEVRESLKLEDGRDSAESKPMELYQGLTNTGAAGMLMQSEDFTSETRSRETAGSAALGTGQFFTAKVGAAAKFVGGHEQVIDESLKSAKAMSRVDDKEKIRAKAYQNSAKVKAVGMIGMATVIRGENFTKGTKVTADPKKGATTSISVDHTARAYDFEMCTKDPSLSFTHHIVGVEIHHLGSTVERTGDGIVDKDTKQLLADKNGISTNIKFKEDIK